MPQRARFVLGRIFQVRTFGRQLAGIRLTENQTFAFMALIVGLVGGLAAVGFHYLIEYLHEEVFGRIADWSNDLGPFKFMPGIVLGGLLVGPLVTRAASEARGHGVPEVMEAVNRRGGRIRTRVASVKAVASALTIGSGGSAGREGPIVQIGSALGSTLARAFRMSDRRRSTFVAAGAAAGIAAIFNAPLAGVFFALEVILRSFTARGFSTVVISAVAANAVWRVLVGDESVLTAEVHQLIHPSELVLYAVLGIVAAVVAVGFVRLLYFVEDRFDALPVLADLRPAIGAITVGILGAISIDLLGSGLGGIDKALAGEFAFRFLLFLVVGKMLATALTLGSGGSGGIFSPSLFVGALLGSAYGEIVNQLFPDSTAPAGAYAVVGMAAVFAAAAQAPMSSIFIVFEMTNDFGLIMPLMAACAAATVAYTAIKKDSIYEVKLRRKDALGFQTLGDDQLMSQVALVGAAEAKYAATQKTASLRQAVEIMKRGREEMLLVVSADRALQGVAHLKDAETKLEETPDAKVSEILREDHPVAHPGATLEEGMQMLENGNTDLLPVLDWNDRVLGVANRVSIVKTHDNAASSSSKDS
ncbi:MAG: chloride channel protein [Acidimicrobiales bacterium]|jgi:CIC family chloride channel protein|nr:chloride channel protein [Acidimicrobiales bacterium]MDP6900516.1 chloride channel protein [Acidimicrobiales bacterium]HJL99306.1 chloride channel protein [Acidimicrobiales bacterium]